MEQKSFLQLCTDVFKINGFYKHNKNYYKEYDDIMVVFGLQKTTYGGNYFYIEYGFVFKSINSHMPYPKYHEANIRQGRFQFDGKYVIEYNKLDELRFTQELATVVAKMRSLAEHGLDAIVAYSFSDKTPATLIQGYDTLLYLGVKKTTISVVPRT